MPGGYYIEWGYWDTARSPKMVALKLATLEISLRAGGFRTALERARDEVIIPEIDANFNSEGTSSGDKWKDLSDITKRIKASKGQPNKILTATGKLHKHALAKARWYIRSDEMTYSPLPPTVDYGGYHLTGTRFMAVRDWLRMPKSADERVHEVFDDWLEQKIKAVF